jgi:hypothetical protein
MHLSFIIGGLRSMLYDINVVQFIWHTYLKILSQKVIVLFIIKVIK